MTEEDDNDDNLIFSYQPDTSVTRDCIAICKQTSSCVSFTVDYQNSRCQSYSLATDTLPRFEMIKFSTFKHKNIFHQTLILRRDKLQSDSGVNFFEKVSQISDV